MLPWEFEEDVAPPGTEVETTDFDGRPVGRGRVIALRERPDQDRRKLLLVEVPFDERLQVAGFSMRGPSMPIEADLPEGADSIVCRCERVYKSEIVREIRAGVRDLNQLKALVRPSMGGCGGKTCAELVGRIMREEGVTPDAVTPGTIRPLIAEMPLDLFIKGEDDDE